MKHIKKEIMSHPLFDKFYFYLHGTITTNFKNMKKTEEKEGFDEATSHTNFFNVGKKNQWKDKLTLQQTKKIEKNFKKEMEYFNYL